MRNMVGIYTTEDFSIYQEPGESIKVIMYFEHSERGDEWSGNLWIEDKKLTDYDGVFELPTQIVEALKSMGVDVSYLDVE